MKAKNTKIYDSDYYKIQIIINDPKFKKTINELIDTFDKVGCPIPQEGFKTYEEYLKWGDKYFNKRAKIKYGKAFQNKVSKITKGKKRWSSEQQDEIDLLESKEVPPVYGSIICDILEEFGIDKRTKNYSHFRDFMTDYIFFKKTEYSNNFWSIVWRKNEKTLEAELFVKILPHTRKKDIEDIWPIIKEEQKSLSEFKGKNRQYKTFYRDLEIYNLYKNLVIEKNNKKNKGENLYNNKRSDKEVCSIITMKYNKDLGWETIRKIVSDMDKMINNVGFKEPH